MESTDALRAVRSGWLFLVGGLLAGMAVAWWLASAATPMYASTTRLLLWASADDPAAVLDAGTAAQQRAITYAEILGGRAIAADVVEELDLGVDPARLAEAVDVVVVPESPILELTVTDPSAERARDVVVALSDRLDDAVEDLEAGPGAPGGAPLSLRVIEPPLVDDEPVSPVASRYYAMGGALGLIAGLAVALVRYRRDTTVKDRDVLSRTTGDGTVIGTVLHDRQLARRRAVLAGAGSASAESFHAMAARLQLLDDARRPRTVAVTGAVGGEGRTTIALNLAAALADSGARVLVAELDPVHPRLASALGLEGDGGVADVLAGSAGWRDVTQPWTARLGASVLSVLPAGSGPRPEGPRSAEALRALLADLRAAHDFVLVDTPPLLASADAALISTLADGCILTARYGVTREEHLTEAAATLSRFDVRLLGVVLNGVPRRAATPGGYGFAPASAATRAGSSDRRPQGGSAGTWGRRRFFPAPRSAPQTEGGTT